MASDYVTLSELGVCGPSPCTSIGLWLREWDLVSSELSDREKVSCYR